MNVVDAGEQLVGGRVHRRAPVDHVGAKLLVEPAQAAAARHRHHAAGRLGASAALVAQAARPVGHLLVHVGYVETRDVSHRLEQGQRRVGIVGVDVHAGHLQVADDQHGIAELLEPGDERARLELLAGHREVRAEAVAEDSCSGRCSGRSWCSSSGRSFPRRAATQPARITVSP